MGKIRSSDLVGIRAILSIVKVWFSWLFSLAEKYQVRIFLISAVVLQSIAIVKLCEIISEKEARIDYLEVRNKNDLRWFNTKIVEMNNNAQRMKDSLYINTIRVNEALQKINVSKK